MTMELQSHKMYALTIFGYKKDGMSDTEYHDYVSNVHAGHLKALLAKNDIVSYTMQHNSAEARQLLNLAHPGTPPEKVSSCDMVIQIVFKDIKDYLQVKADPHFVKVVGPDHMNFADPGKTKFVTGWFEVHVTDGKVVSE